MVTEAIGLSLKLVSCAEVLFTKFEQHAQRKSN